ncbi:MULTISPECIES: divergent polysaccharide deacetylase family protein [unclassified Roseitalea]|uniref:divergent polysaccharide deacetylase family protein n=1 Tax=unclassified Roseitalea TaxID=2639107 RepID=UPI00273E36CB|nr:MULTISPECIES: divergent polysaccharide deacetylase family protein [unclassified Roseitalea]
MRGAAFAAIGVLVLISANVALIVAGDRHPHTTLVTLAETAGPAPDATLTTATVRSGDAAAARREAADIKVVHGVVDRADLPPPGRSPADDPALPPSDTRQVSPGGPKIITIRDPAAASVGQPVALAHLPEDAALEDSAFGPLPVRADDGRRPMDIYARPWSGTRGKRIAIVIGGLGLSQTGTQRAIDRLPPEITLAFAPTGNSLSRWMQAARRKGHELLVQVPMEPFGYPEVDPGPRTLRLASSAETNLENLHWALGRLTNYTGIMNYMGARFVGEGTAVAPVLGDLADRGLLFFHDGTVGAAQLAQAAQRQGVPFVSADTVIDGSQDPADILERLKALEELADARGSAIGTGSALELTVDTVARWANGAKKRGFEIVGVAALADTGG